MRQETFQEKLFHDMLPHYLSSNTRVTFGYQNYLRIIQSHLQTFYGHRADWSKCVDMYFRSTVYKTLCHSINRCEDIPIITSDQLYGMIREEKEYQTSVINLLRLNRVIQDAGESSNVNDIYRAAEILGIMPDQETPGLFSWLIQREGLSDKEKREIRDKISENTTLFKVIINLCATLFVSGMQFTFPRIGTAMTQQKRKYFYRGENSFYGSSKPGIFRSNKPIPYIQLIANLLILNEACSFLDQFDAVKKWSPSCVNYLALVQHYGIKTNLMDITSDLKTALFFACCKYEENQWRPMGKRDFVYTKNGVGEKDSRYGVLYRTPTEITDMKLVLSNEETVTDLIVPIGYQPFMRCSAQHGYMLFIKDDSYDLLNDPLFDKFRIEHDEDFCRWIFDEMDCGAKVYPHNDIPKIEDYLISIKNTHMISQTTFENLMRDLDYSAQEAQVIKQQLQRYGYTVISGQIKHIHYNRLRKINKQYSIDIACSKVDITPKSKPLIIFP